MDDDRGPALFDMTGEEVEEDRYEADREEAESDRVASKEANDE
jgi:hypothetical protein